VSDLETALGGYRRRAERFQWQIPDAFNFGRDVVDRLAREQDGRPALRWRGVEGQERRLTFGDVRRATNRIAHLLEALGVGPGDPVMVMLPRIPEWHLAVVGALKAGALVIPCSVLLRPKDVLYRARHSGAVAILATPEPASAVDAVRGELPGLRHLLGIRGEDGATVREGWTDLERSLEQTSEQDPAPRPTSAREPALVYYTSGTTGPPKAVLHSHAYTCAQRLTAEIWLGLRGDDRVWTTSDTGWAKAAYSVLFGPWNVGAEVFMYSGRFDPATELSLLSEIGPQVFCAPPTEYRLLVKQDLSRFRAPALRECVSAGEPLNPEVIRAWRQATGLTIRDGYGQTETVLLVGNFPGVPVRPGSMGLPMPGHRVEVIDAEGGILPPGGLPRRGRLLLVRGPGRRRDHLGGLSHRPLRGGERPGGAPRRRGGGGRGRSRPRPGRHRQGLRGAAGGRGGG
jgi:acetyl-CoA synthetase/medium-chain acyl-CoA synthetase